MFTLPNVLNYQFLITSSIQALQHGYLTDFTLGRFLLCKVLHYTSKSRKQNKTKTAFEVFSLGQDKEIPVISIDAGDNVTSYALEQNGSRIAVMCTEITKDVLGNLLIVLELVCNKPNSVNGSSRRPCFQV